MASIISLLRGRKASSKAVADSCNGLYPFPVEIWQAIFESTASSDQEMEEEIRIRANWFFSDETEHLIGDPTAAESHLAFNTRFNIIFVCKSWYSMGIQALWSHLKLKEIDYWDRASTVYHTLQSNPALGSYVTRLTIIPHHAPRLRSITAENRQSMDKILPFLTNLKAISCPSHVTIHVPSSVTLEVATIHAYRGANALHSFWLVEFPLKSYFWHHCHTLSISLTQMYLTETLK